MFSTFKTLSNNSLISYLSSTPFSIYTLCGILGSCLVANLLFAVSTSSIFCTDKFFAASSFVGSSILLPPLTVVIVIYPLSPLIKSLFMPKLSSNSSTSSLCIFTSDFTTSLFAFIFFCFTSVCFAFIFCTLSLIFFAFFTVFLSGFALAIISSTSAASSSIILPFASIRSIVSSDTLPVFFCSSLASSIAIFLSLIAPNTLAILSPA